MIAAILLLNLMFWVAIALFPSLKSMLNKIPQTTRHVSGSRPSEAQPLNTDPRRNHTFYQACPNLDAL